MNLPEELTPKLRGVMHAWAMWFALVAVVVLALYAPTGLARAAALVYGIGLCALFAASGLYHRWRWNPRWRPLLRRIDHSTIFIFIAASYTPIALLVLSGTVQIVVLVSAWAGALAGVAHERRLDQRAALARGRLLPRARLGGDHRDAAARREARRRPVRAVRGRRRALHASAPSSTRSGARTRGRASSASTRSSTRS